MDIISTTEDLYEGITLVVQVTMLEDNYWSSVDLFVPDEDEISTVQFRVLLDGIRMAHDKIVDLIEELEDDQ
jgi:hypothetical protein